MDNLSKIDFPLGADMQRIDKPKKLLGVIKMVTYKRVVNI